LKKDSSSLEIKIENLKKDLKEMTAEKKFFSFKYGEIAEEISQMEPNS